MSKPANPADAEAVKDLVVFGASGKEIVKLIQAQIAIHRAKVRIRGFVDDNPELHGRRLLGVPVLGASSLLKDACADCWVINNVARTTQARWAVRKRLLEWNAKIFTAIHPGFDSAYVSVGEGCIIQEGAICGPESQLGAQTLISFGAIVAHESRVGECCCVSPGVNINGRVDIGNGVFLGSGAIVLPNVKVGPWSIVGAGSVVTNDVPPYATVFGAPARVIMLRNPEEGEE